MRRNSGRIKDISGTCIIRPSMPIRSVDTRRGNHYRWWLARFIYYSMGILDQFQMIDDLIFKLTVPPVRTELRHQLAAAREQVEAYQASSDKQDETLARQVEAIAALEEKNMKAGKQIAKLQAEKEDLKPKAARAKKIPEMKDENRFLATELAKERAEVKRLKSEIKLWESGTEPGVSVSDGLGDGLGE